MKKNIYKNPFPVTAVASFRNDMQNDMIVETKAIKRMKELTDKWISDENEGITIAVQGEYGTGKTQLAIELQRYIKRYDNKKYHFICLESPSVSFLEMYKNRFLNEVTKEEIIERLEEYYCEIIINDMKDDEIYKKFLQEYKNIKSLELIERFGLAKSKYDFIFENQMKEVTKDVKFVPALLLLSELRFEKEVWNWFNGSEPTEAMKERGVKFTIDNDIYALDAISVFAFLFGQQGHTFVLFIDEMEKIVSNTETQKEAFNALKKLIETVKATKSMLILCGLPDYYAALPKDTQQRIAHQIKTDEITLLEIEEYICNANEKVNNIKEYIPFSEKILEDIMEISNKNIRMIIRLLYHSSIWYIENNSEIDEKALYEILTSAYGSFNLNNLKKGLIQIFISKGWLYEERKSINNNEKRRIDFWLPSVLTKKDSIDNGIEIYLIQNVLTKEEYKQINEKMSNDTNNCKICVVEGFINEHFYKCLSEENKHVLKYRMPEFSELFISIIEGEKAKCENSVKQNNSIVINEKIDRLSRIVRQAVNDINENSIRKQEFYYFMNKILDVKNEEFYIIPDKDSDFYLLISEIQRILDFYTKNRNEEYEIGSLYLIREFSYILYYISENTHKLQISIKNMNIIGMYTNFRICIDLFSRNCGSFFNGTIQKYLFVLDYMRYDYDFKEEILHHYQESDLLLMDMIYDNDFYSISNRLKQISQSFCAELLAHMPEIIEKYDRLFTSFYYFMYVIEPAIIRRQVVDFDLEILREYYDLLYRYFEYISRDSLSHLFQKYEDGLRGMIHEREY